jgi:hypothetical protein
LFLRFFGAQQTTQAPVVHFRKLGMGSQIQEQVRALAKERGDIGAGLEATAGTTLHTQVQTQSRMCLGIETGLEMYEQHIAFLTTGLGSEMVTELAENTGIIGMLITPVMMVIMQPLISKIKQKMDGAASNPMMDLLADLLFLPLVLLLSIAIVHIIAQELPNQVHRLAMVVK